MKTSIALNPKVDHYLAEGCGRCALGGTPQCKVHPWREALEHLRSIVLACGLTEEVKWGVPCYTLNNKNVLMISALKEYCAISFLKGALLKDHEGILSKPGENSQAARLIRFTQLRDIKKLAPVIKAYIQEAMAIEEANLKIDFKAKTELVYPEELEAAFKKSAALKKAFQALTPGRQRGYILYFNGAKQAATRSSRIQKYIPAILQGKGFHD